MPKTAKNLTFPFEYNFEDYHEASDYSDFLSNLLGVTVECAEITEEFPEDHPPAENESHQALAQYRFRFDIA